VQRVASLEGAPFARQPCYHVLAYTGFRKVALRLILSDDLPLTSFELYSAKMMPAYFNNLLDKTELKIRIL
jgi:hypothetical protein